MCFCLYLFWWKRLWKVGDWHHLIIRCPRVFPQVISLAQTPSERKRTVNCPCPGRTAEPCRRRSPVLRLPTEEENVRVLLKNIGTVFQCAWKLAGFKWSMDCFQGKLFSPETMISMVNLHQFTMIFMDKYGGFPMVFRWTFSPTCHGHAMDTQRSCQELPALGWSQRSVAGPPVVFLRKKT